MGLEFLPVTSPYYSFDESAVVFKALTALGDKLEQKLTRGQIDAAIAYVDQGLVNQKAALFNPFFIMFDDPNVVAKMRDLANTSRDFEDLVSHATEALVSVNKTVLLGLKETLDPQKYNQLMLELAQERAAMEKDLGYQPAIEELLKLMDVPATATPITENTPAKPDIFRPGI